MGAVYDQVRAALRELIEMDRADLRPVRTLAVGCSTSEIAGGEIGHASAPELGKEVASAVLDECAALGVVPAFQCCEHLNRALVIEREAAERLSLAEVCAVPWPKAGGSCASSAYRLMKDPVLVEAVAADAGMDIGDTLIGMHLKAVAVPVRLERRSIGQARLVCARTRPRLIGGERARYTL